MKTVRIVIKKPNKELETFLINDQYLDRLVTNIRLYKKDLKFVAAFRKEYEEVGVTTFLPSGAGIIFIDFVNDVILDAQMTTGIGCVTPKEVIMSCKGTIPDETVENSVSHRFSELFDDGRLKGFEEWRDTGVKLNTKLNAVDRKSLFEQIEAFSGYGQFKFDVRPFKIELFTENGWFKKLSLFARAKELNLIPEAEYGTWNNYLERIRK